MTISGWRVRGILGALSLLVVGALIGAVGHRFVLGHEGPRAIPDMEAHRAAIPAFAEAFPRVAELVSSDAECKQLSRKRFAEYRDRGHTLETHNV